MNEVTNVTVGAIGKRERSPSPLATGTTEA